MANEREAEEHDLRHRSIEHHTDRTPKQNVMPNWDCMRSLFSRMAARNSNLTSENLIPRNLCGSAHTYESGISQSKHLHRSKVVLNGGADSH